MVTFVINITVAWSFNEMTEIKFCEECTIKEKKDGNISISLTPLVTIIIIIIIIIIQL
jgi:small-conductance mechanosensitive channel